MEYIFREHFLPLSDSKQTNIQYYQWVEKKRREKERAEEENLRKKLMELDQEESKDRSKSFKKDKVAKNKENSCVLKPEEMYEKNMIWKQCVEEKVSKLRHQMREENEKEEQRNKQPETKGKEKKFLRDPTHRGPFKAWSQRFQHYLRTKDSQSLKQSQNLFHPTINDKSKRLTLNFTGKVESRLIEYGQRLKEKKNQMEEMWGQELFGKKSKESNLSIDSNLSDTFFRLYKDGQKINRKRTEFTSEYTFTPEINQNSVNIVNKHFDKRKPLYNSKLFEQNKSKQKQKAKSFKYKKDKQKSFSDFLQRNEALLTKISLNKSKKDENQKERQSRERQECTFLPQLNPHSLKIVANKSEPNYSKAEIFLENSQFKSISKSNVHQMNNAQNSGFDQKNSIIKMFRNSQKDESEVEQRNLITSQLQFNSNDLQSSIHQEKSLIQDKKSRFLDSEPPQTDRYTENKTIINEQLIEEDSIEREKNIEWENELQMMESQIQAMMKRTNL